MKRFTLSFLCVFFTVMLSACAPFKLGDNRAGICNELNSKIIFNGSTSNTRKAEIESAERPLQQRSYDKRCE